MGGIGSEHGARPVDSAFNNNNNFNQSQYQGSAYGGAGNQSKFGSSIGRTTQAVNSNLGTRSGANNQGGAPLSFDEIVLESNEVDLPELQGMPNYCERRFP